MSISAEAAEAHNSLNDDKKIVKTYEVMLIYVVMLAVKFRSTIFLQRIYLDLICPCIFIDVNCS